MSVPPKKELLPRAKSKKCLVMSRSTVNKSAQNPSQTKEQSVDLVALVDWQFIKLQKRRPGMSATSRSLLKLDQALNRGGWAGTHNNSFWGGSGLFSLGVGGGFLSF